MTQHEAGRIHLKNVEMTRAGMLEVGGWIVNVWMIELETNLREV